MIYTHITFAFISFPGGFSLIMVSLFFSSTAVISSESLSGRAFSGIFRSVVGGGKADNGIYLSTCNNMTRARVDLEGLAGLADSGKTILLDYFGCTFFFYLVHLLLCRN